MKKQTLIITIVIITVNSTILSAQTTKGKFLIGELSYIEIYGTGS